MSDQPNSVRLQDRLMQLANLEANELAEVMQQAADRIEADEALMKDALSKLDTLATALRVGMPEYGPEDQDEMLNAAITALHKRLEISK